MVTGFDILTHDARLRRHWLYRTLAFITDALIVFIPVTVIMWYFVVIDIGISPILVIGLVSSLVFFISSAALEVALGATAGKLIFGLRVHSLRRDKVAARIILRNTTRLIWFVLPPLDFALGMATRGDPRQRLLDRIVNTTVVIESERKWHEAHLNKVEEEIEPADQSPIEEDELSSEEAPPKTKKEETCHACGGRLIILADEKMQCNDCGLIQ